MPATKSTQRQTRPKGGRLPASDLARLIGDTVLFASRDATLPSINGVSFESTAERLVAVATDRFTLGVATVAYEEAAGHDFSATFQLPQLQILARIAKACKKGHVTITATRVGEASGETSFQFSSGETLTLPSAASNGDSFKFPDWRHLLNASSSGESVGVEQIAFNPALLARFSRVSGASQMVVKLSEPNKPAVIAIGGHFIGLVMPVRIVDGKAPVWQPDWLKRPEQPKRAVKAPAKTPAKKAVAAKAPRATKKAS